MAWNGIESVKCNICGNTSTNNFTMEVWNETGQCPGCEPTNSTHTIWFFTDGNILEIQNDERSERFSMDALAKLISQRGIKAYVEMTGGWVATIYVGTPDGEGFYPVAAGPGSYQHRDFNQSVAYWEEFCYGRDDQGETKPVYTHKMKPLTELADEIVAFYNNVVANA